MNEKLIEDADLIGHLKELHADADTSNFNVLDFASAFGNPLDALVYSKLFWPDFIEFENMIFLSVILESDDDRSRVLAAISRGINRVEIEKCSITLIFRRAFLFLIGCQLPKLKKLPWPSAWRKCGA